MIRVSVLWRCCRRVVVGYARVSTAEQNPVHQTDALHRAGVPENDIYVDVANGANASLPQFDLVRRHPRGVHDHRLRDHLLPQTRQMTISLGPLRLHPTATPVPALHQWTLDEDAAAPLLRQAIEFGVTFWATANVYQRGTSEEEFVGRAISRFSRREDIVLATKVGGKMHGGPGGSGLSRKAILEQVDASLRRLGTDYIAVYCIYRFDPARRSRRGCGRWTSCGRAFVSNGPWTSGRRVGQPALVRHFVARSPCAAIRWARVGVMLW
jgi:hypothetical protein